MCQTENVRANCSARWALAVSQSYRAMCYPVGSSNLLFSPNPTQELHCWHRLWWKGVWRRCLPRQCLGEDAHAIQVLPGGNVFKPWQQYVCNEINGLLRYKTWGAPTRGVCSGRRLRRAEILCSHNPKLQVMCTFPFCSSNHCCHCGRHAALLGCPSCRCEYRPSASKGCLFTQISYFLFLFLSPAFMREWISNKWENTA